MRFFYKCKAATILALFLSLSGCVTVNAPISDFQNQVSISTERVRGKNIAFDALRELIRQTNNEDSKQILAILETKSVMVEPTNKGFRDPIFKELKEKIKIVVLLPEDVKYRWWGGVYSAKTYAFYFPALNAIVLKRMDSFSSLFSAIIIDHEGWHTRYAQSHMKTEKYTLMQISEAERDTYEHGALLLSVVGGEKYKIFMQDEMKRFEVFAKNSPSGRELPVAEKIYNKKLDEIFGVAKSFLEQETRSSFVWVAGVFQYIDKHTEGTQAEKEIAKTKAFYDAYVRVGAH
jgi:hypothetical protein